MNPTIVLGAVLLTVNFIGVWVLRRFSPKVRIGFDLLFFILASAFLLNQQISPFFVADNANFGAEQLLRRAMGGAWWLLGARLLVSLLRVAMHRDHRARETRLFSDLMAGTIYLVAGLIVLNSVLALPVRGVLATSGIIAVVLGLALQNTLADVFSGIAVGIEAPFRVGDRIKMNDQVEGQVVQVNWRSIRILTDSDDIAIFPNSVVAKAEIINRSFPSSRRTGSIHIPCSNAAPPETVIEALLHAAMLCPAIEKEPVPSAGLVEIKRGRNIFKLSFGATSSHALSTAQDQLMQRSQQTLRYAGLLVKSDELRTHKSPGWPTKAVARQILEGSVLFESLADHELQQLADSVQVRRLKAGETLFSEGENDATLYLIAAGVVEFDRKLPSGKNELIGVMGPGEYVGEIGMLTGSAHGATGVAKTRCMVLQLSKACIAPLLENNPDLAQAFEESVQHGLDLLKHTSGTHSAVRVGSTSQLLARIRGFFSLHTAR